MPSTAPPAETAWLLHHVLGFDAMSEAETLAILEESTKLAEGVMAPLDAAGDRTGARFSDGRDADPAALGVGAVGGLKAVRQGDAA
ncbi:MAG TPA: hypothetical protein VL154_02670, partial [Acetobacteraceae bacterium]|nr:hypothetical protein [Acetobacteraceae bacterium]